MLSIYLFLSILSDQIITEGEGAKLLFCHNTPIFQFLFYEDVFKIEMTFADILGMKVLLTLMNLHHKGTLIIFAQVGPSLKTKHAYN